MKDHRAALSPPLTSAEQDPRGYPLACGKLALSMALVGAYVALSRPLVVAIPIFLLAWMRFGIGSLAMLHWLKKPAAEPPLRRTTHAWLFLESLLGNFLFSIFMLYGMRLTSAVTAGIVMASIPAAVALLSRIFLREHMTPRTWLAVVLAMTGMTLAQLAQSGGISLAPEASGTPGSHAALGPLLLLAAVLCEAAYVVIGKKLTRTLGARRISALINLWGLALMTPLGLMQALHFEFTSVPASLWLLLIFYALAASVWSVWLWMTGLHYVPAAQSGVFTVFLPISAALVGVLFLGERMNGLQIAAFSLALLGVISATLQPRRFLEPQGADGTAAPPGRKSD